jgi:hypothetical protein
MALFLKLDQYTARAHLHIVGVSTDGYAIVHDVGRTQASP